jgi:hypothetical protein
MSDKSSFSRNAVVNALLRNTTLTGISPFVALFIGDPYGAGVEVSTVGTNYSRQSVTFSAPSNGATSNSNSISFGVASASYGGTVSHFALMDNSTGGNILYADALTVAQTVNTGNEPKFAATAITVQES